MAASVAEVMVATLKASGTRRVYGIPGDSLNGLQDLPTNHSPKFLPPLQPTLRTGTEALVTAALAWLEPR